MRKKMQPAISIHRLSKSYKLGVISRQTLVDEVHYWWCKVRNRDPREHFSMIGHTATEARRVVAAEDESQNQFWALQDVSFDVQPGEVVGIIGRNGAGKSTLLKILSRITEPTSGSASINGRVAALLEVGTGFHPELTGRENIYLNGAILGMNKRRIQKKFDEIVSFSELEQFIDTPVKRYSNGMRVRLAFSVAAYLEPEILMVDEVLAVGDMEYQKKCVGKIHDVSKGGRTVLFVSHNMPAISRICSRAILLDQGRIIYQGTAVEVVKKYMHSSLANAAHREWEEDNAPGAHGFKLLSVSLTGADGQALSTLDIEKGFSLRIKYQIRKAGMKFRCMANFYSQGVCAFPAFEQTSFFHEKSGGYVAIVNIPGNMLAEGEYVVGINIFGERGKKYNYCNIEDVITFLVVDYLRGGSARGDFAAGLHGVMRPLTTWRKEYIG